MGYFLFSFLMNSSRETESHPRVVLTGSVADVTGPMQLPCEAGSDHSRDFPGCLDQTDTVFYTSMPAGVAGGCFGAFEPRRVSDSVGCKCDGKRTGYETNAEGVQGLHVSTCFNTRPAPRICMNMSSHSKDWLQVAFTWSGERRE